MLVTSTRPLYSVRSLCTIGRISAQMLQVPDSRKYITRWPASAALPPLVAGAGVCVAGPGATISRVASLFGAETVGMAAPQPARMGKSIRIGSHLVNASRIVRDLRQGR